MLYKYGPIYLRGRRAQKRNPKHVGSLLHVVRFRVFRNRTKTSGTIIDYADGLGHGLQVSLAGMAVFLKILDLGSTHWAPLVESQKSRCNLPRTSCISMASHRAPTRP